MTDIKLYNCGESLQYLTFIYLGTADVQTIAEMISWSPKFKNI